MSHSEQRYFEENRALVFFNNEVAEGMDPHFPQKETPDYMYAPNDTQEYLILPDIGERGELHWCGDIDENYDRYPHSVRLYPGQVFLTDRVIYESNAMMHWASSSKGLYTHTYYYGHVSVRFRRWHLICTEAHKLKRCSVSYMQL